MRAPKLKELECCQILRTVRIVGFTVANLRLKYGRLGGLHIHQIQSYPRLQQGIGQQGSSNMILPTLSSETKQLHIPNIELWMGLQTINTKI